MTEAQTQTLATCRIGTELTIQHTECDCGAACEDLEVLVLAVDKDNLLITAMVFEEDAVLGNRYPEGIMILRIDENGSFTSIDLDEVVVEYLTEKEKENAG